MSVMGFDVDQASYLAYVTSLRAPAPAPAPATPAPATPAPATPATPTPMPTPTPTPATPAVQPLRSTPLAGYTWVDATADVQGHWERPKPGVVPQGAPIVDGQSATPTQTPVVRDNRTTQADDQAVLRGVANAHILWIPSAHDGGDANGSQLLQSAMESIGGDKPLTGNELSEPILWQLGGKNPNPTFDGRVQNRQRGDRWELYLSSRDALMAADQNITNLQYYAKMIFDAYHSYVQGVYDKRDADKAAADKAAADKAAADKAAADKAAADKALTPLPRPGGTPPAPAPAPAAAGPNKIVLAAIASGAAYLLLR